MELFWPALKETKRFADPKGKIEIELIESMVAIHHVNNPYGSCARLKLMDDQDFADLIQGKDGRNWEVAFHGTSTLSSLEIIKKCDWGASAFKVTDDPMQSCLEKMQKYRVTPDDLLQNPQLQRALQPCSSDFHSNGALRVPCICLTSTRFDDC